MKQLNTKLFFTVLVIAVTSSCAFFEPYKVPIMQGNIFEEKDINKLEKGMTKAQVDFLFGKAVIMDPFHKNNRWDYFNSVTIGELKITEQKLSIFFNEEGLVDSWILERPSKEN